MNGKWTPLDFKAARVRAALKQKDAARAIGISLRMLAYFEAGERNLSIDKKLVLIKLITEKQAELERKEAIRRH